MTNTELIAKIRNEIERLRGICTAQIKANPGQTFSFVMEMTGYDKLLSFLSTIESENQKEQQELGLKKFTEKMDDWKARYNHPDNIPIKATMAFTARMFYMYPKVAREWYESLPKATQD